MQHNLAITYILSGVILCLEFSIGGGSKNEPYFRSVTCPRSKPDRDAIKGVSHGAFMESAGPSACHMEVSQNFPSCGHSWCQPASLIPYCSIAGVIPGL